MVLYFESFNDISPVCDKLSNIFRDMDMFYYTAQNIFMVTQIMFNVESETKV